MTNQTWIVYKADSMSAEGWEERKLMPSGNGTDILWENWSYSDRLPTIGSRTREYLQTGAAKQITHGKSGDWVVSRIEQFSSHDTKMKIAVCYCTYQPIEADWQSINRGSPVDEMTAQLARSD